MLAEKNLIEQGFDEDSITIAMIEEEVVNICGDRVDKSVMDYEERLLQ